MGTATQLLPVSGILTWDAYLNEGEVNRRYNILEGQRIFMPAPTLRHQRVQQNTYDILRAYERQTRVGIVVSPPFDVLIRRLPRLRTRQPDALFIRHATLAQSVGYPQIGVLTAAPELIVEIVSDSEREQDLEDKLTDYASIGVKEAWIVRPDSQTVEVKQLVSGVFVSTATYATQQSVQSLTFPDLIAPVAEFFLP